MIFDEQYQTADSEFMPMLSVEDDLEKLKSIKPEDINGEIPVLPLRNTVLFPGVVMPISIGREKSIKCIKAANKGNKYVVVLSQKEGNSEDLEVHNLYTKGCLARVLRMLNTPDGNLTAIIQGVERVEIKEFVSEEPYIKATVSILEDILAKKSDDLNLIIKSIRETSKQIIELSHNIPNEANFVLKNIKDNLFLLNFITSNIDSEVKVKQEIFEENNVFKRAEKVLEVLTEKLKIAEIRNQVHTKARIDIDKQQREFYLNQQLKTIQEELGAENPENAINQLIERSAKKKWNEHTKQIFDKEIQRLRRMNPASADYSVHFNYVETLIDLPWNESSEDNFDLKNVQKVLDEDHYGLEKVKERIIEHLAILKLKGDMKAPILCFVGPPGVGKTSLGKSIATALKRKYVRMALGGLHDEAEIRGHRKTYIGAMPGKIIQGIKKAGTDNPVYILDEIDKVGKDFRGDPSSALLEVLDPEQNNTFQDNYIETEFDLSKVLFIATANSLQTMQPALLDRMETIELSGYSVEEKVQIAKKYLIPEKTAEYGITLKQFKINEETIQFVIANYTRESGVRELGRVLGSVLRKVAKKVAMGEKAQVIINKAFILSELGKAKYNNEEDIQITQSGVVIGLAWTPVGGDILHIEANKSSGSGKLLLTGNLGDVMKESATTALSYLRANAKELKLKEEDFSKYDFHIHVPEGAIPKDGPSAGITMLTVLASVLTNKKVKPKLAMSGEITLRGKVLPVGGIKEKILAAKRAGITHIILSEQNKKDVEEINAQYIRQVEFSYVQQMRDVLKTSLHI